MVLGPVWGTNTSNSRSGPRASLGPVPLTIGVALGPVWDTNNKSGQGASLGPVALTVGVVLGPVWGTNNKSGQRASLGPVALTVGTSGFRGGGAAGGAPPLLKFQRGSSNGTLQKPSRLRHSR